MVTTVEEYNKQLEYVINEIKERRLGGNTINPPHLQTYNMDKPIYVYTSNNENYIPGLINKKDHYEMFYPRFGDLHKTYINDLCWLIDKHTIFIIERPFQNRVVRLLQHLLPNSKVLMYKNDVMIDNYKIGPTCMAGQIDNMNGSNNKENSSMIYCLRWDNLEELNEFFKDDPNHQKRMSSNRPLKCLSEFLNMSREEFMELIETQE